MNPLLADTIATPLSLNALLYLNIDDSAIKNASPSIENTPPIPAKLYSNLELVIPISQN
jgi:hypothetical protein